MSLFQSRATVMYIQRARSMKSTTVRWVRKISIRVCICVIFAVVSSSSRSVPGRRLDEAKDVAIEPVGGRTADSKRLARLEPALWTE